MSDPVLVTSAGRSGTAEREARMRRYAYTQAVRVACLILAVLLPVPIWAKLLLMVGALVLPWLGVVAANGGPTREKPEENALVARQEPIRLQLDEGRTIDQE